jgi:hypothetical protein
MCVSTGENKKKPLSFLPKASGRRKMQRKTD